MIALAWNFNERIDQKKRNRNLNKSADSKVTSVLIIFLNIKHEEISRNRKVLNLQKPPTKTKEIENLLSQQNSARINFNDFG